MDSSIYKMVANCDSILNYGDEKKGTLDEKARAECKSFKVRLALLDAEQRGTRELFSNARGILANATDDLKRATLQSRRALQMVALGERKMPAFPAAVKGRWLPSRIYSVAVSHLDALNAAGDDPVIAKAAALLKPALAAFAKANSEANAQRHAWVELNRAIDEELPVIAGKLRSYQTYATYSVPGPERQILRNRIKAAVPPRVKRAKAGVADAAHQLTTTPPAALPAVPTTPVPPSSEHPIVSANA